MFRLSAKSSSLFSLILPSNLMLKLLIRAHIKLFFIIVAFNSSNQAEQLIFGSVTKFYEVRFTNFLELFINERLEKVIEFFQREFRKHGSS